MHKALIGVQNDKYDYLKRRGANSNISFRRKVTYRELDLKFEERWLAEVAQEELTLSENL
jgi:hypothetical protein